ncbi:hypothetical protein BH10PSE19_BH10PSE19_01830 [soil metagenome]
MRTKIQVITMTMLIGLLPILAHATLKVPGIDLAISTNTDSAKFAFTIEDMTKRAGSNINNGENTVTKSEPRRAVMDAVTIQKLK